MKPKTLLVKNTDGLDQLIASASKDNFGRVTLGFLSNITPIENFGAYHVANLNQPRPLLSFWSGRISDYWFQRDADLILADADTRVQITELVQSAPDHSVMIDRWHPPEGSNRRAIYDRNGIIERIGVSSKDGHVGLRSFYLRSHKDGWISDDHYAKLRVMIIADPTIFMTAQIKRTQPNMPVFRGYSYPLNDTISVINRSSIAAFRRMPAVNHDRMIWCGLNQFGDLHSGIGVSKDQVCITLEPIITDATRPKRK